MQTTLTAKLKLITTPEQFTALRQTQLAYRDALNQVSQHAFARGKTSNSQRLHYDLYDEVRTTHGLPSQIACSVFRQVGPPTRDCGRSGTRTWKRAKLAGRGNASKAWTNRPTMFHPP